MWPGEAGTANIMPRSPEASRRAILRMRIGRGQNHCTQSGAKLSHHKLDRPWNFIERTHAPPGIKHLDETNEILMLAKTGRSHNVFVANNLIYSGGVTAGRLIAPFVPVPLSALRPSPPTACNL